ncbi:hypothetical protein KY285_000443 [Solanum tuberosum]|nr:hypothetical protein KY285_000443 [Solanum tuberosum]
MVEVTDPASTPGGNNIIDISNPFCIHPSDGPSLSLVQVEFLGTGYRSWRRSVMRSLSVKNKLGFINGECKRPALNSPQYRQWERCDNMITSWILKSLGKEIVDSVEYVCDAMELWKELEYRYDQTNGAKLYQIQKEINDLSQGVLDITVYYNRMKKMWEELNNMNANDQCSCVCSYGGKENIHKAEKDRRLIQFLMGLNEVYTIIRGSILMMNPLPSMAQAFALLVLEEKQREFKPSNQMFAKGSSMNSSMIPSVNASLSSSSNGGQQFRTHFSTSSNNNGRSRPYCEHCRKPGHTKDRCYKIHGYPQTNSQGNGQNRYNNTPNQISQYNSNLSQSYRSAKGKGIATNAFVMDTTQTAGDVDGSSSGIGSTSSGSVFTNDQYGQLLNLLQHFQLGNGEAKGNHVASGAANFANSGATHHMTFNKNHLSNILILPYPCWLDYLMDIKPFNEESSGDW